MNRLAIAAACAAMFAGAATAHAQQSGTWNANASDDWSDSTRWLNGIVADGATFTAAFTGVNLTGSNKTVNLDTSRIIGRLNVGDATAGNDRRSYTISTNANATLTFDNNGSASILQQTTNSNGDTISVPIILNNDLNITNSSGTQRLTISAGGITAGTTGLKTISIGATAGGDVTFSGIVGDGNGSIAIVKGNANNDLTLSGGNTFTGGVTLNAGLLLLNNASALGTGTLTITGGNIGGNTTMSTNNLQNWNGDFGFGGGSSLNLGTGAVTLSGNRTITIGSSNDTLTIGGVIDDGAGSFSLNTANSTGVITGILGLSGANTYEGGTNINGGVVRFNSGAAIPATGLVTIQTGGALSVSGAHGTLASWMANTKLSNTSTGALSLAGDSSENFDPAAVGFDTVSLGANVGANVDYTGTYTPQATGYYVGGGGGTINFLNAGAFVGNNNLTVGNGGGGTVIIAEDNAAYSGNVTVANGTLQIGSGGTVGSLGMTSTLVNNSILAINRSDNPTLGFAISGTGTINQVGTGMTTLNAVNSYSGDTMITNGTLRLGVAGAIPSGATLILGAPTTAGNLDLNGFDLTVATLDSLSSNNTNTSVVTITPGKTLTVTGNATFGRLATGVLNNTTFTGGGNLALTGTGSTLQIGVETSTSANISPVSFTTLDLTGLGSFTTDIANFNAVFAQMSGATTLLSNTNNTIKATTIRVAHSEGNNPGAASTLTFGTGTNIVQADSIQIAISKAVGTINFASQAPLSPGTVTITDKAGTGGANFIIASTEGTGTANSLVGHLDLRGHLADVTADSMQIGKRNDTSTGSATGTVSFDTGTFTATSIDLGNRSNTGTNAASIATGILDIGGGSFTVGSLNMANKSNTSTGSAVGTVNVSGGTFTVNTLFRLGQQAGSGTATGELNITGGTVTSNVDITDGGGAATTSVTLDGGTLDLTNKNLGSAGNPIDNLVFRSGTLRNVAAINGTDGITKTTAGVLTLAGMNTYLGNTLVNEGTLIAASNSALGTGSVTVNGTAQVLSIDGAAPINVGGIAGLTIPTDNTLRLSEIGDMFTLSATGNFALGDITLDLNNAFNAVGDYTVIDSTIGGNLLGTPTFVGTSPSFAYNFSIVNNDAVLSVTAIPEPSTLLVGSLTLLGFAGFGLRRRRTAS